ncbi:MAG: homoserine O-succinyltransferase [Acidimicrobiales bacterium]
MRLVQAAADPPGPSSAAEGGARWTCAFVNNMPDGAFEPTERQFVGLLEAGSGSVLMDVKRFAMEGVPRGERAATRIAEHYWPMEDIRLDPPDLLIVTGSNPLEERISHEPYWDELADLLSWGSAHVGSMLLSCLSAHAALEIFDGIERVRLAAKCTGVFAQEVDVSHPLGSGLERSIVLPHSRTNTVPQDALHRAGYHIAIQSEAVGWSVATRDIDGCQVVLVQGHPEYEPSSLLREYQRDVLRYVHHERDEIPSLPLHCVAPQDWAQLEALHRAVTEDSRDPALVEAYPFAEVGARSTWPWSGTAQRLYANWLAGVSKRSDDFDA